VGRPVATIDEAATLLDLPRAGAAVA
jgi:hypothetical protein